MLVLEADAITNVDSKLQLIVLKIKFDFVNQIDSKRKRPIVLSVQQLESGLL